MILREEYPPDIRVDKEIRMLQGAGYEIALLCYGRAGLQGDDERQDGVIVRSIQPPRSRNARRLNNWWNCVAFRDPYWRPRIADFARDLQLEALHVHDLPLVGTALQVAHRHRIPLVADLHENYPAAVQNYHDSWMKKRVLYSVRRWTRFERWACERADRVICVIDESKQRLVAGGIPQDKIVVVPNATHPDFAERATDRYAVSRYGDRFVVSYIGAINTNRDIESLIRAVGMLRQAIPQIFLLAVGNGPEWHMGRLRALAQKKGIEDLVEFTGWRPFGELPSYIEASDVCILPLRPSVQAHASGPHKFFQYAMMGKPIVLSDCRSLQRLARESQAALSFESQNPASLAGAIEKLYRDAALRKRLGMKGRDYALNGPYSWQRASANLAAIYAELG